MKESNLTKVFTFNPSNQPIRVEVINNEPWFVAKDVCDVLDHTNHRVAVQMTYNDFETLRTKFRRRKLSRHLVMQMGENITKWKHEVDVPVDVKQGIACVHGRYKEAGSVRVFKQYNSQTSLFD
jgi:hypothetical protein